MGVGAAIFNTVPRDSSIEKHLSEAVKKQIVLYEGCTVFHTSSSKYKGVEVGVCLACLSHS